MKVRQSCEMYHKYHLIIRFIGVSMLLIALHVCSNTLNLYIEHIRLSQSAV